MRDGFAFPTRGFPIFEHVDGSDLQRSLGDAAEVTMVAWGEAIVASGAAPAHITSVTAALANYLTVSKQDVATGRFFTDGEALHNAPVVVLSHKLAAELSPDGNAARMVDDAVRVNGRSFTVIGILPPYTGETSFRVIVPLRAAATTFAARGLITPTMIVHATSIEGVAATKADVEEWVATRYRDWQSRVSVTTSEAQLEQVQSGMLLLKLILGSLSAISLVVGGVGIMNVLLASVAERTREIGVRKALGARQRDILYQFLSESVAIASVGSGVGAATGFAGAFLIAAVARQRIPGVGLQAAVTAGTVLTSVISAAVIGLAFGTLPALRAARLSPIDAMRND
jgi:putative ABC transport system permease protein